MLDWNWRTAEAAAATTPHAMQMRPLQARGEEPGQEAAKLYGRTTLLTLERPRVLSWTSSLLRRAEKDLLVDICSGELTGTGAGMHGSA